MPEGVTVAGSGPGIVLCHGMLLDRTMFSPQLDRLAGRFRVAAYDQRAATDRGEEPYRLAQLADDCRAVIASLGFVRPVLGGMSMGGLVALRVAVENPGLLSGLVLIASSPAPEPSSVRDDLKAAFSRSRASPQLSEEVVGQEAHAHFARHTLRTQPELVGEVAQTMRSRSGTAAWHELRAWIDESDLTPALRELDLPVLIVHGAEDQLVPVERGLDAYRAARRSRLCVAPYAGHAVNLEAAEAVSHAIAAFREECLTEEGAQV